MSVVWRIEVNVLFNDALNTFFLTVTWRRKRVAKSSVIRVVGPGNRNSVSALSQCFLKDSIDRYKHTKTNKSTVLDGSDI